MTALIKFCMYLDLTRLAGFLGRVYAFFYGYTKFTSKVAPLLKLDRVDVEEDTGLSSDHHFAVVGRVNGKPPFRIWPFSGPKLKKTVTMTFVDNKMYEVEEMPLPHIRKKDMNAPGKGHGYASPSFRIERG